MGLLARPSFTGAVALLVVNDVVLKDRFPSWWTGKLSDFAGVYVVAVLLGVVTGRANLAIACTALGFVAIKVSPAAASLAAPVLGGTTLQDTTDLIALAALLPAGYALSRTPRLRPPRLRLQRALLVTPAAMAAMVAITATSCAQAPEVDALVSSNGAVFARVDSAPMFEGSQEQWAVSSDGGREWSMAPSDPPGLVSEEIDATEVCGSRGRCYRLADHRVEERAGAGAWATSFALTGEQRRRVDLRTTRCEGSVGDFSSIAIVDLTDGEHVVVGMGLQGVLHRGPGGEWERRAVLDVEPPSLSGPSWLRWLFGSPLLLFALSPIPLVLARHRGTRKRANAGFLVAAIGSGVLLGAVGFLALAEYDYAVVGPAVACWSVAVFVASVVVALTTRDPQTVEMPNASAAASPS